MTNDEYFGMNGNSVTYMHPSRDDLFVVTTVFGKQICQDPITHWGEALDRAKQMARLVKLERPVVIKVLCLSFAELTALGFCPPNFGSSFTSAELAELRAQGIKNCKDALFNSKDPQLRKEAYRLLQELGDVT